MTARSLEAYPIHLGRGGTAVPQPEFPRDERAMQWYEDYGARHDDDGEDGRLVSCFRFTEDWAGWEMHPAGAEVVVCVAGSMTLIQEIDGAEVRVLRHSRDRHPGPAALSRVLVAAMARPAGETNCDTFRLPRHRGATSPLYMAC